MTCLNFQRDEHFGRVITLRTFESLANTVKLVSEGSRIFIESILPFISSNSIENATYFLDEFSRYFQSLSLQVSQCPTF